MPQIGNDAYVQVAPNSTGASIRNLSNTQYPSGTSTVVNQQVVTLADEVGNLVKTSTDSELREQMLLEMRLHTLLLQKILDAMNHERQERGELIEELNENNQFYEQGTGIEP